MKGVVAFEYTKRLDPVCRCGTRRSGLHAEERVCQAGLQPHNSIVDGSHSAMSSAMRMRTVRCCAAAASARPSAEARRQFVLVSD